MHFNYISMVYYLCL